MKQLTSLIIFFLIAFSVTAQTTPCEVAVDALKGTYEGECTKGKANGEGTATGTDTYKGTFKSGYPDGTGKYTWKNGDYYFGKWKKGAKEGKGEMHTFVDGKETVKEGFWKKDQYRGEHENPYKIHNVSSEVGRVQVSKVSNNTNRISISIESLKSGTGITGESGPVRMSDAVVRTGIYLTKSSTLLTNKEVTVFQTVTFPFRAMFVIGSNTVDVEIFEEGDWDITIPIGR